MRDSRGNTFGMIHAVVSSFRDFLPKVDLSLKNSLLVSKMFILVWLSYFIGEAKMYIQLLSQFWSSETRVAYCFLENGVAAC